MKKLTKNKIVQGIVSLVTIIILLSSILAVSLFYQTGANGNVVRGDLSNYKSGF